MRLDPKLKERLREAREKGRRERALLRRVRARALRRKADEVLARMPEAAFEAARKGRKTSRVMCVDVFDYEMKGRKVVLNGLPKLVFARCQRAGLRPFVRWITLPAHDSFADETLPAIYIRF